MKAEDRLRRIRMQKRYLDLVRSRTLVTLLRMGLSKEVRSQIADDP